MGLILEGVLNMPYPDDPAEMGVVEWVQARGAMRQAWMEIVRLRSLVDAAEEGITAAYLKGRSDEREEAKEAEMLESLKEQE